MPEFHPQSNPFQYQAIYDLSGGMVTNWNFTRIQRNQYDRLLNGDLIINDSVVTRKGRVKVNTTPITGNPAITSLAAYGQSVGPDLILAGGGGEVNEVSSGAPILIKSGLDPNAYLANIQFDNFIFYCNGVDKPFMTQATAATTFDVGIVPFTAVQYAGITVALGAAAVPPFVGLTAGTHRFAYRYRSTITGARSNPYIVTATVLGSPQDVPNGSTTVVAVGGESLDITIGAAAVSADPQVDVIDIFMQEANAGVGAPYYFITTVPNAVAGPFNVPDADTPDISDLANILRERLDIDDNQPPVTLRDIETWRGRLIGIVGDYNVQFSKQRIDSNGFTNLPTSWPALNSLEVGFGDGDPLVKVVRFYDYIMAFKRRSIWLLVGDFNAGNFAFKRLKTNYANIGLLNQKSIAQASDRIFFVSDNLQFHYFRITDFSTQELRLEEPIPSEPIANLFTTFASAFRENVNLVNFSFAYYDQIWIAFSDGSSGLDATQNFNVFVFDYGEGSSDKGSWHIHTGIEVASSILARDSNRDYFSYTGDYFGFVWKQAQTTGDGALINGTSTGGNYNQLNLAGIVGVFLVGETVQGGTSGATGIITATGVGFIQVNATDAPFLVGEVVTGLTSGATGTITSQFGVLNDTTQNFLAPGLSLEGTFVRILSGPGVNEIKRITAVVSATQVMVTPAWAIVPTDVSVYTIGGIDFQLWSRFDWLDEAAPPDFDKYGWYLDIDVETSGNYIFTVQLLRDRNIDGPFALVREFQLAPAAFWGSGIWGLDVWAVTKKIFAQVGFDLLVKQIQHRIVNGFAGQPLKVNGWTYTFQQLENLRLN